MTTRGVAEAYLSSQRSTLFGRAYDLSQETSFEGALEWLTGVLEDCVDVTKEGNWDSAPPPPRLPAAEYQQSWLEAFGYA